ncbi:MAG: response regulator transcription factor [Chloroflexi bacterium]|nr:response regulator transcription factor [Chloroflexota bacterium]
MARIFIVDDHLLVRQGYVFLICRELQMEVCGEAASGLEALEKIPLCTPDAVVLDISLSGDMNGIQLLKQLQTLYADLPVLVVSGHDERIYAERILRLGARGYVMKGDPLAFMQAIRQVVNGETYANS